MTDRAADQRAVINRLKRAEGQLRAVIASVEAGADCRTVVTQLSAVSSALDRAGFSIVSSAMRDCLSDDPDAPDQGLSIAELEKLFLSLA
jgi:DNA-binding FrmR family transcriptional regulator